MSAATERARTLLANLPIQPPEWYIERTYNKRVPDHYSVDVLSNNDHVCSVRGADEGAHALAELIAAAPGIIADLLNELATRTDPELAARLVAHADFTFGEDVMGDDLRAAARMIGGTP